MPNALANLVLLLWPVVTVYLFRKYEPGRALILSILVGYLFLPEPPTAYDFPLIPPLTKHTIPALAACITLLVRADPPFEWLPTSTLGRVLVLIFVFSPIVTTLTNDQVTVYGALFMIKGLGIKDGIAMVIQQMLLILPFLMARQHLRSAESHKDLLKTFMIMGLVYSLFMLVETRLSPQFNMWIYGFYQHDFGQSIRFGGYRPVVFLYHGLWVAFFCLTACIAAFGLWKMDRANSPNWYLLAGLYLFVVLFLAKSLGSLAFALLLVPLVLLLNGRLQMTAAAILAIIAISYPAMKGAGIVPETQIIAKAAEISEDRAGSVKFRFDNENTLLARSDQRPLFGWGNWGRNQVYDGLSGKLLTVTDGRWIITIGVFGWVGFIAEFGLLLMPIFLLWREYMRRHDIPLSPFVPPMTLLLAINVIDMIPNATLTPLTWLFAGSLLGYAEFLKAHRVAKGPAVQLKWQSVL
ncbi:hypothetical protein [Pseudoprimorskyibacter insulae]|uniref:Uncharacterized protein n=1 Tax=Pseudoprimorskyibacter insulae TaxID=1695997 RepID=A0A2R8AU91_9RHOB|nr:hypothetical protein [Pseudoprimorskyibacter insulae]SPF79467.1 hypothetical protein PRI8871_01263 [Pseudoprimorskyibacter insulae]